MDARVAFGGVAHKPWRSLAAEDSLRERPATMATYRAAAEAAMRDAVGQGGNDFKIELARRTLCRTLDEAARAPQASLATGRSGRSGRDEGSHGAS